MWKSSQVRWTDLSQRIWIRESLWIQISIYGHLLKPRTQNCLNGLVWCGHLKCKLLLRVSHQSFLAVWPRAKWLCGQSRNSGDSGRRRGGGGRWPVLRPNSGAAPLPNFRAEKRSGGPRECPAGTELAQSQPVGVVVSPASSGTTIGAIFFLISEPGPRYQHWWVGQKWSAHPAHQAHWDRTCCQILCLGKSMLS